MTEHELVRLPNRGHFPRAKEVETLPDGFVPLACEIDRRIPFTYFLISAKKRRLLGELKRELPTLLRSEDVKEVTLLKALLIPPGRGVYLEKRPDAHVARFDVAILLRSRNIQSAEQMMKLPALQALSARMRRSSRFFYQMVGKNARRLGRVDHERAGVFLLNYFFASDLQQNLDVFEYTAGWFQQETGLDNSVLIQPLEEQGAHYTVINHARWDRLTDVLPSLLFKPSFRRYVLKHFEVNDTAAMPVLYKLA